MLTKEQKTAIVQKFGQGGQNPGCPEVQVALLTARINGLAPHFQKNALDYNSNRGLMKMIGTRKSLLKYLQKVSEERYKNLIQELGLRK